MEQDALAGEAVASGATGLLLEGLDRAGEAGVDDAADVGAVDAHAEGDGGADDVDAFGGEVAFDPGSLLGGKAGVVGVGLDAAFGQALGEAFGVLA